MSESEKIIWEIFNEYRAKGNFISIYDLVMEASSRGLDLSYNDVSKIHSKTNQYGESYVPDIITLFVNECLTYTKGVSLLDPWARVGEFIDAVAKATKATRAIGIIQKDEDFKAARILHSYPETEFICSDPVQALDRDDWKFDVVICCPPFSSLADKIILKASPLLTDDGIAFFVVPQRFFLHPSSPKSLEYMMKQEGLYIDSAIYLPSGTFGKYTSIPSYIVSVQRKKFDNIFVAELSNYENIKTIANNWINRIEGRALTLGALIERDSFYSFPQLVIEKEISRLSKLANLAPIPLKEIAKEINREKKGYENGFEEKPNSIYLPLIGMSECINFLSDLKIKPQNYIQIILDSTKVNAEYVARFFNTELGKIIRKSNFSGFIPKLTKSAIENVVVFLPPMDNQIKVIGIQNQISALKSQLLNIEKQLWSRPLTCEKHEKNLNRKHGLENWIETLPFPLASILWRYFALESPHNKKEQLFNFFEALIQFNVMIMLSASNNDKDKSILMDIQELDIKNLYKSTFGTWLVLGEQLAKKTRQELSHKENREKCMRIYRQNRIDLLEVIISKKLFESLRLVLDYRNRWKGHGGVESDAESKKRLTLLEAELSKIREAIADCYDSSIMIKPEESSYSSGIFYNKVQSLMGTRTMFKKVKVETTTPLDVKKLYLIDLSHLEPLELIPLIRLMPSPTTEENAFYFYNRIEKNGMRWVSYHFEKESEIIVEDEYLQSFLSSINNEN